MPSYRLVGSLLHFSERLAKGGDGRLDGYGGGGHTQFDSQATREKRRTITALTLTLTLEAPNGVAIRGASTVYRINVEKTELNRSISLYVGGSGIGGGTKVTITQDSADAMYDAIAYALVHILGNALFTPYYRCSTDFPPDTALDARVRDTFNRATRSALEENIKRYLFLNGLHMDMQSRELTDQDRAVVVLEMHRHGLEFGNRAVMVDYVVDLWKNLNYTRAAARLADRLAESAHLQREAIEQQAREAAELNVSPLEFGWPESVALVVLDMSRIWGCADAAKDLECRTRLSGV